MKRRLKGSKTAHGLLTALMAGVLVTGANAATNYDKMVTIPAGKFIFGNADAKKKIKLPAYQIDKYEVTNKQYAKLKKDHEFDPAMAHFPVVSVSQMEAGDYCKALGKRLPTEQEWEKAARGKDGRIYPWGNEFDEAAAVTNETASEGPMVVGSRKKGKSPYGAMDMAGNVWEWTSSYEGLYVVLKGGSYYEGGDYAMVYKSINSIPDDSKNYIGFRCAKAGK
jgi:iron(II)-dependent oxidoreductase